MIYVKNLPGWERWSRAAVGLGLMVYALMAAWGGVLGWALLAAGVMALLTAFVGFCPLCAMVGRKAQP